MIQGHLALCLGVFLISLSSCTPLTTPPNTTPPSPAIPQPESPTSVPNAANPTPRANPDPTSPTSQPRNSAANQPAAQKTVAITLFKPDRQCTTLVSEKVAVSADQPIQAAVGKVLAQRDNADFSVAGYRVNLDAARGVATIDLRLPPDAKRSFASLSSCEQLALFGSLRKTLTSNAQWQVKTVRFTQQGQEIAL